MTSEGTEAAEQGLRAITPIIPSIAATTHDEATPDPLASPPQGSTS